MMNVPLSPLKFRPLLLQKPWGGDDLWKVLQKGNSGDLKMGESWELSDRPNFRTVVTGGPQDGMNLVELNARFGSALLGEGFTSGFPLLYKFICAREKLSVQVHPGEGSPLGEAKTECWYVVEAKPGAELIIGVAPGGRSREETLALLKSSRCEEVLRRCPARRGDVFFIPAGTVHAITEGLLLYEVQQNSDTTFRIFDWDKVDAYGKSRPLHVKEAAQVADLEEQREYRITPSRVAKNSHSEDYLISCPFFELVKWHGFRGPALLETGGRFRVLTMVSGSISSISAGGDSMILNLGDTVLVPACCEAIRLEARSPNTEVIVSFVPV